MTFATNGHDAEAYAFARGWECGAAAVYGPDGNPGFQRETLQVMELGTLVSDAALLAGDDTASHLERFVAGFVGALAARLVAGRDGR